MASIDPTVKEFVPRPDAQMIAQSFLRLEFERLVHLVLICGLISDRRDEMTDIILKLAPEVQRSVRKSMEELISYSDQVHYGHKAMFSALLILEQFNIWSQSDTKAKLEISRIEKVRDKLEKKNKKLEEELFILKSKSELDGTAKGQTGPLNSIEVRHLKDVDYREGLEQELDRLHKQLRQMNTLLEQEKANSEQLDYELSQARENNLSKHFDQATNFRTDYTETGSLLSNVSRQWSNVQRPVMESQVSVLENKIVKQANELTTVQNQLKSSQELVAKLENDSVLLLKTQRRLKELERMLLEAQNRKR